MKSTGICRWLFLLISLSTWTTLTSSKEMRVVCYYTNWSVYRPGAAKFSPQNINPYLCTHLVYAFGGFTKENTLKPFDKYQDIEKGGYAKFTGLKTYNKNLKTMLAIGGWNEGSSRFSPMVANAERRRELVKNAIKFLRQNHFDGLDLDWEYPSFRDGGKPRDRDNYAQLVQELREEFDRESEKTGRTRLLLTMAVPAGIEYINKGYDIPKLTKYLDWMNILSYDYHSAFEPAVNHHAPLYSLEEDNEYNYDAELNIDFTIKHYLKLGADPDKLILGIPTYGRSYTLFNPEAFEIGSPADGPGEMGEATRENGYLAYYEICDYVKNQGWQEEQPDPNAMGPYAFKENQWVGYDDMNVVRKKAEYVAENELGGIMFWAIDNDDFRGNCHGRPYPLIESAKEALMEAYGLTDANLISPPAKPIKSKARTRPKPTSKPKASEEEHKAPKITNRRRNRPKSKAKAKDNEESPDENPVRRLKPRRKDRKPTLATEASTYSSLKVTTPSYTTPAPPSTPDLDGAFKCEDEGFFPHPKDCKKYFWCLSGAGDSGIIAHQFTCPAGLYFNKAADSCDYTQNVLCNKKIPKAITSAPPKSSPTTSATLAVVSTTRPPPKITAATSRTTFKQSTTTEASDADYEYEDEEEEEEIIPASEEDPKVIKELIDLIKKAGGIEELEKQLSKGGATNLGHDTTTQSAISKTLYERVLSKAKTTLNAKKNIVPSIRNSRGPQNDGLSRSDEKTSRGKTERGKLQYTSISRQRSSTPQPVEDEEEEEEEEAKENAKPRRLFNNKSQPEYVTIRRPRVSTTTEAINSAGGLNRNKILGEVSEDEEEYDDDDDDSEAVDEAEAPKKSFTPQYVNIRRQRPSTTEETSTSKYTELRRGPVTESNDENEDSKYQTIKRGSTTSPPTTVASNEVGTTKYLPLRRGLTTTSTTPSTVSDESTSKYKNFRRGTTTTEKSSNPTNTSTRYVQLRRGTTTSTTTATTSSTTESTITSRSTTTTRNLSTPTDEENYVTPSFQSSSTRTTSAASETVVTTVSVSPIETSLGSSSVTSSSTTASSSTEESTTNSNINLVNGAVTTIPSTTTKKETSSPGTDRITTKSANEDTTTMESRESSVSSESVPVDVSTTTQRHRTRPLTSNGRSTTVKPPTESTTASKVSQSKFKLRLRQKTAGLPKDVDNTTVSTTENPTERNTIKYRGRGSVRATQSPNVAVSKEEEDGEDTTSKIKPRRRPTTTERPLEERTYRPAELNDLSSLTAVDFEKLKEVNADPAHRRRRPTPPPTTTSPATTTEEEVVDPTLKTSARTLPLARKRIDPANFGKSRRVIPPANDNLNSVELDASATTKRGRGFGIRSTRQPSTTESSEVSASTEASSGTVNITPRSRRVVRRFRTTTARSNRIDDTSNKTSSDKPPFRRGKIFAPQSRNQTSVKESTVEAKSVRPNNNLQRLFNKKPARLPFGLQKNKIEEETDDSLEDSSTEEGENIKLSESNIRENSDVNSFDTSGKQRRKLVKLIRPKSDSLHDKISLQDKIKETGRTTTEPSKAGNNQGIENETTTKVQVTTTNIIKETTTASTKATEKTTKTDVEKATDPTLQAETTTFTENPTIPPTTTEGKAKIKPAELNNVFRARKVIKKLKPKVVGTTTFDKTTGRRRKLIRRRPVNSTTAEESKDPVPTTTESEKPNPTQTTISRLRTRPTTTPKIELNTTTARELEKEISRRVFRPSLTRRTRPTLRPIGRASTAALRSLKPSESSTEALKVTAKQVFRPKNNLLRNKLRPIPRRASTKPTTRATTTFNTPSVTIIPYNTDTTPVVFNTIINNYETTTQAFNPLRRRLPQRRFETTTPEILTELAETTAAATDATTTTESTSEMSTEYTVEHEEKDDTGKVKIVKSSTSIYNLYKPISDESEFDGEESKKNTTRNKDPNRNYVSVFRSSTTSNTFDNFDSEFEMETPPHLKEEKDEEEDEEEDDGFGDDEYSTDHYREIQETDEQGDEVDRLIADTSTEYKSEIMGDTTYFPYDEFRNYESLAESSSVSNRVSKPDKAMEVELTTPSKTPSTSPRPKYKTFSKTSNKSILKETIKMISSINETDPDGKLEEVVVNRFKYRTLERTTAIPILKDDDDSSEDSDEFSEETTRPMDLTTLLNMDDSSESIESNEEGAQKSETTTENYSEELTLPNSSLEPDFTTHFNLAERENEIFDVSTNSNEDRTEKPALTTVAHSATLQTDNILNQITSTTSSSISPRTSTPIPNTTETPEEEITTDSTESTVQEVTTTPIPKPTTPYQRRSTLRSIESRPKFAPVRRKNTLSGLSTTEATKALNRFRARYRSTTESASTSEKPIRSSPVNRFLYRTSSTTSTTTTTEKASIKEESDADNEETTENDDVTTEYATEESVTENNPTSTAVPIDRFIYSHSTTEVAQETVNDEDVDSEKNNEPTENPDNLDEEKTEEKKEVEPIRRPARPSTNFRQRLSTTRPRVVNRPLKNIRRPNTPIRANTPHFGRSTTPRVINKPNFAKTTESTKPNEDLSGIDTLAVKNRNKNLFSKKRKINRPASTSSTTVSVDVTDLPDTTVLEETSTVSDILNEVTEDRITSASPVSEAVTKPSAVETTESLTTLHHIFAAVDNEKNNTDTTTESASSVTTTTGKIEKLVEVNRIVQVKTKGAKVKNHHVVGEQSTEDVDTVIDKIGQVNRVTVIKVVNGNETTTNDVDYNDNEIKNASPRSPVYVPTGGKPDPLKGIPAKVEEIPAAEVMGKLNLTNITVTINSIPELLHTHRENRKFEAPNKNQLETGEKTEIVDGISHVNVFTPRPVFSTEASTIALEGLFQTDSPQTIQTHNKFLNNDEILETENSRFVNVRVLHTDDKGKSSKAKEYPKYVPAKIFGHDHDEVTLRAEVVEVTPKSNPEPIKIVPIRVEMSKKVADSLPVYRVGPQS